MINLTIIDKFLKFPYSFEKTLAPLVIFFLVFYGGYAAPKLPDLIVSLFENPIFRIFILSLIVYKGNSNPSIAILISVGFTVVMDRINKQSITENFNNRIENFMPDNTVRLPDFVVPGGKTATGTLTQLCLDGLRNSNLQHDQEYIDRLKEELEVISERGFSKYFLTNSYCSISSLFLFIFLYFSYRIPDPISITSG